MSILNEFLTQLGIGVWTTWSLRHNLQLPQSTNKKQFSNHYWGANKETKRSWQIIRGFEKHKFFPKPPNNSPEYLSEWLFTKKLFGNSHRSEVALRLWSLQGAMGAKIRTVVGWWKQHFSRLRKWSYFCSWYSGENSFILFPWNVSPR